MSTILGLEVGVEDRSPQMAGAPRDFAPLLLASGLTFFAIGASDLALLWVPFRLGNPRWEFGTISAHYAGMPLATVGFGLLSVASLVANKRWFTRATAICAFLGSFVLLAMAVIFLLTIPLALEASASGAGEAIAKAIAKTIFSAFVYVTFYFWAGVYLWRFALARTDG
jgi:hypothetical protein